MGESDRQPFTISLTRPVKVGVRWWAGDIEVHYGGHRGLGPDDVSKMANFVVAGERAYDRLRVFDVRRPSTSS